MINRRIRVLTVFGTRPDAIKMAPLVLEFKKRRDKVDLAVAVTGQHREMLDQVLSVFEIEPDYDLDIMQSRQTLSGMTCRALEGLEKVIKDAAPDIVIAQGDTATTFVASLAAFYNKAAFGHVEAGLRTDNKYNPFPEEMNRRLTSVIADLHFAPTEASKRNLINESVPEQSIYVTGNTVIDALLHIADRPYSFVDETLSRIVSECEKLVLVTAHRRENWGEPIRNICDAVKRIIDAHPDIEVVFPMHKNPIVRETVIPMLGSVDRAHLIEPPDYVPFVHLIKSAYLVITDSGGVQEEAPAFGKPVLVLRETTERPEGVAAGNAKLIGTETQNIVREASVLLGDGEAYRSMSTTANPYGDGHASERICQAVFRYFERNE